MRKIFQLMLSSLMLLMMGLSIVSAQLPQGNTDTFLEAKVKAAYLFNFTKFVQWPDQSDSSVSICIVGAPQIKTILQELSKTKPFHVISEPGPQYSPCQILYIDRSANDFDQALSIVKEKQVLTVSNFEKFTQYGGIIGFFTESGKVRLEININIARDNDIIISSKLLELARIVDLSK
jgi:hypothetical protein